MKKGAFIAVIFGLFVLLCSCMERGPYSAPLNQPIDEILKVDLVDGRNEYELFYSESYANTVICTLDSEQMDVFLEGLLTVEFFVPSLEPSRHLGELAARVYYKNGNSDIIGSNCCYYVDSNFKILDRGTYYPNKESFYTLFGRFIDTELMTQR